MGRKNKFETHIRPHLAEIPKLYTTMTEGQIAKYLGVSASGFENYKRQYPELREALRVSKDSLAEELRSVLKKKAMGFYYEEEKTVTRTENGNEVVTTERTKKYAQPDTGAIHLLLKNIDREWHNDDVRTLELKEKQVEIQQQKADDATWTGTGVA